MGRVFIVEEPHPDRHIDLRPAEAFGEVRFVLPARSMLLTPKAVVGHCYERLHDFNDDDFLICLGNPGYIGAATTVAALCNDYYVNQLQWDRRSRSYIEYPLNFNPNSEGTL